MPSSFDHDDLRAWAKRRNDDLARSKRTSERDLADHIGRTVARQFDRYGHNPHGFDRVLASMATPDTELRLVLDMMRAAVMSLFEDRQFAKKFKRRFEYGCEEYTLLAAHVVTEFVGGVGARKPLTHALSRIVEEMNGADNLLGDIVSKADAEKLGDLDAFLEYIKDAGGGDMQQRMQEILDRVDQEVSAVTIHVVLSIVGLSKFWHEMAEAAEESLEHADLMLRRVEAGRKAGKTADQVKQELEEEFGNTMGDARDMPLDGGPGGDPFD